MSHHYVWWHLPGLCNLVGEYGYMQYCRNTLLLLLHKFLSQLLHEVTYVTFQERITIYVQFYTLHAKLFSWKSFFPIVSIRNMKFKPSLYTHWRCIHQYLLNLTTRWKWLVSLTPMPLYPLRKDSQSYPLNEAVWVPEENISCQGPNYNFESSNPYSSQYDDHDIPASLYNAFGSNVCSRRGAITLKSSDLKKHVSVMCTFEFSTGPVREDFGIPQLFLSLKNSPTRHRV